MKLFVATAHGELTPEQISGLQVQFGGFEETCKKTGYHLNNCTCTPGGCQGAPTLDLEIVYLHDVDDELSETCKSISPITTGDEVKAIAEAVVAEAREVGCDHFYIAGEPSLVMYANQEAGRILDFQFNKGVLMGQYGSLNEDDLNYLMGELKDLKVISSCSQRVVTSEKTLPNGSVKKISQFVHANWRELN